jgi:hypothetical protein
LDSKTKRTANYDDCDQAIMLVVTMAMMTTTLAKHTNETDNGDCEGGNDGDNDGEDDGDEDGNGCNRDDETNVDDVGVLKAFEDACSGWVGGRAIWAWGARCALGEPRAAAR